MGRQRHVAGRQSACHAEGHRVQWCRVLGWEAHPQRRLWALVPSPPLVPRRRVPAPPAARCESSPHCLPWKAPFSRRAPGVRLSLFWGGMGRGPRSATQHPCAPRPCSWSAGSSPAATAAAACAAASTAAAGSASPRRPRARTPTSTCPLRTWRRSCSPTSGVSVRPSRRACVGCGRLQPSTPSTRLVKQEGTDSVPGVCVVAAGTAVGAWTPQVKAAAPAAPPAPWEPSSEGPDGGRGRGLVVTADCEQGGSGWRSSASSECPSRDLWPQQGEQAEACCRRRMVLSGARWRGRHPRATNTRVVAFQRPQTHRSSYSRRPPRRPPSSRPTPTLATTPTGSTELRAAAIRGHASARPPPP